MLRTQGGEILSSGWEVACGGGTWEPSLQRQLWRQVIPQAATVQLSSSNPGLTCTHAARTNLAATPPSWPSPPPVLRTLALRVTPSHG